VRSDAVVTRAGGLRPLAVARLGNGIGAWTEVVRVPEDVWLLDCTVAAEGPDEGALTVEDAGVTECPEENAGENRPAGNRTDPVRGAGSGVGLLEVTPAGAVCGAGSGALAPAAAVAVGIEPTTSRSPSIVVPPIRARLETAEGSAPRLPKPPYRNRNGHARNGTSLV
jgi:hypothetical protein